MIHTSAIRQNSLNARDFSVLKFPTEGVMYPLIYLDSIQHLCNLGDYVPDRHRGWQNHKWQDQDLVGAWLLSKLGPINTHQSVTKLPMSSLNSKIHNNVVREMYKQYVTHKETLSS
jgi:hypothetical protein